MDHYFELFKDIERDINADNLEKALNSLIEFSERLIDEPRIVASVFGSRKLDAFCQAIGAKSLQSFAPKLTIPPEAGSRIVIIASEVYRSGGHTAVIKDLINAYRKKGENVLVIIADTFQTANHVEISAALEDTPIVFAPKTMGSFERLVWLQKQILTEKPKHTFLFNHMQDAVIVAALQPNLCLNTSFYHHSDHRFSLGVFLAHVKHVDFRESGLENCRYGLGLENNWLLPLASEDLSHGALPESFFSSGALRTCTTGSYKFDAPYAFSLGKHIVADIIAATGGSHLHIGPLSKANEQVIRQKLEERKIPQDRFIVIELVSSLWTALRDFDVDLYIDSFPICGCRSVVEVMGAGIPLVVHENYKSRLLSNKDFVYKEAFCWREPDELIRYLVKLDSEKLKKQSHLSRQHYEQRHTALALSKALTRFDLGGQAPAVPRLPASFLKDECFEFFEYSDQKLMNANLQPQQYSKHEVSVDNLVTALKVTIPAKARDGVDKMRLSEILYANSTSGGDKRSHLSEALAHAAQIAYPDESKITLDNETVSEFLFRFSVNLRDTDIDLSALDKLPDS